MNFIKNGAGLKRKINVILTLQVSESDINTSEYKGFRILSCYDMLEKYDYRSSTDSKQRKLEYMLEEIIHSEYHILICNTHLDVVDFETLSEMLMPHELIIDEILVPNESKRNKKLADGQEAYRNHSRWLHFYPGEIEDIYERFEAEIKSLKTRYKNTETKILEV